MPVADRLARERQALAGVDRLLAVQRQVVLPALDDRRREQTRARQAALDRPLRRLRDHHGRRLGGLSGQLRLDRLGRGIELAGEFRPVDADDDERAGPALDDFADGLAAPPKRGLPLLEDLGRQDLDVDARQLLRQRSPPATAPTRRRIVGVVDAVLILVEVGVLEVGEKLVDVSPERGRLLAAQEHPKQLHRQLPVVLAGEALGLLPRDDPPLEHPAALQELHVELPVLLALRRRPRQRLPKLLELGVPARVLRRGHALFLAISSPPSRSTSGAKSMVMPIARKNRQM